MFRLAKTAEPVWNLVNPTSTAGLESELTQSKGMDDITVSKPLFNIQTPSGSLKSYICTGGFPQGFQNSADLLSTVKNGDCSCKDKSELLPCKTHRRHHTKSTPVGRYPVAYDSLEKVILEETNIHNQNTRADREQSKIPSTASKENGANCKPVLPWDTTNLNMGQKLLNFVSPGGAAVVDAIDLSFQNNASLPQSHNGRGISNNVSSI